MRILLDECIDRRLTRYLPDHEVATVPQMDWAGKKNGELLRLAEGAFDVFITIDQNLFRQQNLSGLKMAVILLKAVSNRLVDLLPLIPDLEKRLQQITPGSIHRLPD